MQMMARAIPVKSKKSLAEFAKAIDTWPPEERSVLLSRFGKGQERWWFQEIEGKPYIIVVTEADSLEDGYRFFETATDRFSTWFRAQVQALSDFDPGDKGARSFAEFIYELRP